MNNILQLKGQLHSKSNTSRPGSTELPARTSVNVQHLDELLQQLVKILEYWEKDKTIRGALLSAYYYNVVAKSNRIKGLMHLGSTDPNDYICGSKFFGEEPIQHVFTYYVKLEVIQESINRLKACYDIVKNEFNGIITSDDLKAVNNGQRAYRHGDIISKTNFAKVIADANYVQRFTIDRDLSLDDEVSIVTIYQTDVKTKDLFGNIGIEIIEAKMIDETTIRLDPSELALLKSKAPYLIAMTTTDWSKLTPEDIIPCDSSVVQIPHPKQEPTVGVIDTLFYEDVYFTEWVKYTRMVDKNIATTTQDCTHGTEVTSIIVDGPSINPNLDDGCGRFQVRHFGVATGGKFSSFTVLKSIREIISTNRDIKVWNLSLGSTLEINRNFISPEAAEIDKIQCEYDVVFVIAGTNKPTGVSGPMLIGAPADSLNSIVVNAVDFSGKAVSYHRVGPVLSFFQKPDVSYYGGESKQQIRVCSPFGEGYVSGTSFAAPWITRKMAFLIHNMGFSREIAKALLIDSAAGWDRKDDSSNSIGYGVVPQRIESILQTHNDEIRFMISGSSDAYETYNYNLPIPISKGKQPFFARATLCYFPKCARYQGVDYTSTELDIHFGRIQEIKGKTKIVSINDNKQGDEGFNPIREAKARKFYRKWDNVKLISDLLKPRSRPREVFGSGTWGLSIKAVERLRQKNGKGIKFGVVVTLKEMYGENRIDEFIKLCIVRGWIVNKIDIENQLDVFISAEENLTLE